MRIHRSNVNASSRREISQFPKEDHAFSSVHPLLSAARNEMMMMNASVQERISDGLATVSDQVAAVSDGLTTVSNGLSSVSDGLGAISDRVVALESASHHVNEVDARVNDVYAISRTISGEMDRLERRLTDALSAISDNASRVSDCYQQLGQVAQSVTLSRESSVNDNLSVRVGEMSQDLRALSQRLDEIAKTPGESINQALEDYKRVTNERLEKLVNLFLSIRI